MYMIQLCREGAVSLEHERHNSFDEATAGILKGFAQRISRRGLLARFGRLMLTVLGVSVVPLLPVDRIVPEAYAAVPCTDWRLCGLWGRTCDNCPGGSLFTCPGGFVEGFSWMYCGCTNPSNGSRHKFEYVDCCVPKGGTPPTCSGTFCQNHPQGAQPAWCVEDDDGSKTLYRCTYIQDLGTC